VLLQGGLPRHKQEFETSFDHRRHEPSSPEISIEHSAR
jgi:hypothetical protein